MFAIERFVATEEDGQEQHDGDQEKEKQDKLAQYLARVQQRRGENEKESKKKRKRDTTIAGGQDEEHEEDGAAPVLVKKDKGKQEKRKKGRLADAEEGEEEEEEEHVVVASEGKQAKEERKRERKEKKENKRSRTDDKAEPRPSPSPSSSSPTPAAAAAPSPSSSSLAPLPTQRSSGLEMIRRMLSGHMAKPSRTMQAPPPPPIAAAVAAAATVKVSVAPSAPPPAAAAAAAAAAASDDASSDGHTEENQDKEEKKKEKKEKKKKGKSQEQPPSPSPMDIDTASPPPPPSLPSSLPPSPPPTGTTSITDACARWGLDPRLPPALAAHNIHHFFPVQARVLPYLLPPSFPSSSSSSSFLLPGRDAVICAPTGSGKTLVYVLTLLQALSSRRVGRLRGLVVVPTRDLAMQVYREFMSLAPSVGVSVALAIGQTDFEAEQEAMLRREGGKEGWVDVVVATPGRLMDHMDRTKGFTLEHLRYLVLDEVDRLVNQSYQEWAQRVHDAAYAQRQGTFSFLPSSSSREEGVEQEDGEEEEEGSTCTSYKIHPTSLRLRPTHHIPLSSSTSTSLHPFLQPPIPLRKLLFSATFTSNPQKLARLNLRNPRYFSIDGHVIDPPPNPKEGEERDEENLQEGEGEEGEAVSGTPATLKEEVVVCSGKDKPLVLLALLLRELQAFSSLPPSRSPSPPPLILIFTSSLDSTHRLCRLLQLCAATVQVPENSFALPPSLAPSLPPSHPALSSSVVCEFSSSLSQPQRAALLQRCLTTGREGGVRVLVASDGMARGIDLPNVSAVVNYDCPRQAKTYIHRVGRTARAGREGRSVTLLKQGQEKEFERLRKGVGDGGKWKGVGRLGVGRWGGLEMLMPGYKKALRGLRDVMGREKGGRLKATEGMSEGVVREVLRLGGAGGSGGGKEEEEEEEEEEEDDEEGEEEEEEEEDD